MHSGFSVVKLLLWLSVREPDPTMEAGAAPWRVKLSSYGTTMVSLARSKMFWPVFFPFTMSL